MYGVSFRPILGMIAFFFFWEGLGFSLLWGGFFRWFLSKVHVKGYSGDSRALKYGEGVFWWMLFSGFYTLGLKDMCCFPLDFDPILSPFDQKGITEKPLNV